MKIICLSDTHGMHDRLNVPDGDVIIFSGDITNTGKYNEAESFITWLNKFPHKHKIIIAGNHDWVFYNKNIERDNILKLMKKNNMIYLEDDSVIIKDIKFYGSPWQPWFCNWAFNLQRGAPLKIVWNKIPNDTNVLITHSPPNGILDKVYKSKLKSDNVGCVDLLNRIKQLKKLKCNIFGHIHSGYGIENYCDKTMINASICNEQYQPVNKPIEIII